MKPLANKIIVELNPEQKEELFIKRSDGTALKLYIGRTFNENGREANPVACKVLSVGDGVKDVEPDDILLVHHNLLTNPAFLIEKQRLSDEIKLILCIPVDRQIFAKVNSDDGEPMPLFANTVCRRIEKPSRSSLLIDPVKSFYSDRVEVVSVAPDVEDVKRSDVVLIQKHADYEVVYHWQDGERRFIKVWSENIIGIIN